MMGLSNPIHIVFLLGIALLVFGAKRLPEIGQSLGSGMRGFKESLSSDTTEPQRVELSQHPTAVAAPVSVTPQPAASTAPESPRQAA